MDRSRKVTYRAGLLDPRNLTTQQSIEGALAEFGVVLNRENYGAVLAELFRKQHIAALVLSGINDEIGLNDWILNDFPKEPKSFENSFAHRLLAELANFFLFYVVSADEETASLLRSHHRTVQLAPQVIQTLLTVTFLDDDRPQSDVGRSALSPSKNARAKASQSERRKVRRAAQDASTIDTTPFAGLQLRVPKNRAEADDLCQELLVLLQNILVVFLNGTRLVEVAEFIKSIFIPQRHLREAILETEPPTRGEMLASGTATAEEVQVQLEAPVFFPTIQPMKVAFYFDTPDDFGEWRILLAFQAQSDITEMQRRDKMTYNMIMIKMKELSNGFFPANNQKRLTGSSTDIPIYEAKVSDPKDLRIVYNIDCTPDYSDSSEVQALRIFGIFILGRIDHGLWKSVSRFLTSRGREYHERCVLRAPHPDRDDTYLPRSFPNHLEVNELDRPIDCLSGFPSDDMNQLHQVISLEKYVVLSKALLESIDANRDARFPFEVSKHERDIIQYPLSCYVLGRSGTGKTTTILFKMLLIERAYQLSDRSQPPPKQMFITKSQVLMGKVEENFMTYFSSLSFASHFSETASGENNMERCNHLPEKFTDLKDAHFPLFVTFDHLCMMIEADIQDALLDDSRTQPRDPLTATTSPKDKSPLSTKIRQFVDFDRFVSEYWPHFPWSLTTGFDALSVWNEIMGVISGSEGTLHSHEGYLDRQTYLELSSRISPIFADRRDTLYDIFVAYIKQKRELQDFDAASRTHAIIRFIVKQPHIQKISHIYVDETQDNLLIDTLLLRLLCSNADGLFWAGDTAQTISAGSSFRFNDLKAFQHRIQKNFEKQMLSVRFEKPRMFYLSVNYRSHAGIVNCAHSVIDVIKRYWKDFIDSLPRERGNAYGAKPIFYTDLYSEFMRDCHFLSRDSTHRKIELGAHQCILVRDDKAKEKLSREIGYNISRDLGLIVTLYDSKGLEFNDVVLYNFFQDSAVDAADWRLVLHEADDSTPAPRYNHRRHAALCSELKSLYVAVTRARNNLRIVDESVAGEPMRVLWESRDQVMSCKPGEEPTDFAKPSGEEEWADRAQLFFENQKWLLAFQCYEKVGNKQAAAVAHAHHQREQARRMPTRSKEGARASAFTSAAEAFVSCAKNTSNITDKMAYFKLGAECYGASGKHPLAAKVYLQGGRVVEAATIFYELGKFDEVHALLTQSELDMASIIPGSILDGTRLHYISKKEYRKTCQLFTGNSVEELLRYLAVREMDRETVGFLLHLGRIEDAVKFYLAKGQTINAIDLFLHDEKDKRASMARAKHMIFQNLWRLTSLGIPVIEYEEVKRLLNRSYRVELDVNEQEEIRMFRSIINGRRDQLAQLANSFMDRGNLAAAMLCFDYYFSEIPSLIEQDIEKILQDLRQFSEYVSILQGLAFLEDPINDSRAERLFGIQTGEEAGTTVLLRNSLLYDHICTRRPTTPIKDGATANEEFIKVFHECLQDRLLDRVTRENDACRNAPALRTPCLKHLLADCDRSRCNLLHIVPDITWFENWVGAHLLQIFIYQSISRIQFPSAMLSQRRFWLIKLYEAVNPSCHVIGATTNMASVMATFPKAVNAVLEWTRAASFDLPNHMLLTFAMQTADFALMFDRKEAKIRRPELPLPAPSWLARGREMLNSLSWSGASSVNIGLSFIHFVIKKKTSINIYGFCNFIERICALFIVCNCLQRLGNLHFVMLPRSWLKVVLDRLDVNETKLQSHHHDFRQLLQSLESVIRALLFPPSVAESDVSARHSKFRVGPEFDDFEPQLGSITQAVFIARLCRVLGLLGCNTYVEQFRSDILTIFTSIRRESTVELSPLYACYFNAKTFDDIHLATSQSMHDGIFDQMIKLLHASSITDTVPEILPVRNVVYSAHNDLLSLLQAVPIGSSNNVIASARSGDEPAHLKYEPGLDQQDDLEPEVNRQSDTRSLASGSSVQYSSVCPGSLPELLSALETISDLLDNKEGLLKTQLTQISGSEQGEINADLAGIINAMKTLRRLQQQMEPGLHSERNIGRLTMVVEEIFDFIETIQPQIPEDLQASLDIVHKAFSQEEALPPQRKHQNQGQRGRRPPLVMDDLYDLIQEAHEDPSEYK